MRELSRLLIEYRKTVNCNTVQLKDIFLPKNFDTVITVVRAMSGYDPLKKAFKSPSLAIHLGTSLKAACDELRQLVLRESCGFQCAVRGDTEKWMKSIKEFKNLVVTRWNIELASLASKDLQEKQWQKPLLMPLVKQIKIFREEVMKIATECSQKCRQQLDDQHTYKLLVQSTLSLVILFNRRRIGDVQFLKIDDYHRVTQTNYTDFENALSETEKLLTKRYKRILNSGKGSRAVVILLPEILENFINIMLENRNKYLSSDNNYVFAIPGSKIKWGKGDVAIRTLAKIIKLENPENISSNKLRKQIATVTQILNLTKDEAKQFSNFMGHTQKTHDEFL